MADRAPLTVTVHACPDENLDTVRELLAEEGIAGEFADEPAFALGLPLVDHEAPVGAAEDLAAALLDLGTTFELHQDAHHDHDAVLYRGAPDLGVIARPALHSGVPALTEREVLQLVEETDGRDDLVDALDRAIGGAWKRHIAGLPPQQLRPHSASADSAADSGAELPDEIVSLRGEVRAITEDALDELDGSDEFDELREQDRHFPEQQYRDAVLALRALRDAL